MEAELYFPDRNQWRSWLSHNYVTVSAIWLVYYKKHTGRPSIPYVDSVEEALCFGWIDGLTRRLDDQRYANRFTPRKSGSRWSPTNIQLAEKMIKEGKMTPTGRAAFDQRIPYDEEILEARAAQEILLTTEIENKLRTNALAWDRFNNLAPSHKKRYIGWIRSAKKRETMDRRLDEVINLLLENKKLGMK